MTALLCAILAAAPSAYNYPEILGDQLPDGRFVEVESWDEDDYFYSLSIYSPDGKYFGHIPLDEDLAEDEEPPYYDVVCSLGGDDILLLTPLDQELHPPARHAVKVNLKTKTLKNLPNWTFGMIETIENWAPGQVILRARTGLYVFQEDGKQVWHRTTIPGPDGKPRPASWINDFRVMADGTLSLYEQQPEVVRWVSRDFKHLRSSKVPLILYQLFQPTPEGNAWFIDMPDEPYLIKANAEGGKLERWPALDEEGVDSSGAISFVGLTSDGSPVVGYPLRKATPKGLVKLMPKGSNSARLMNSTPEG